VNALPGITVVFAACNHAPTLRALLDALDGTDWPDLRITAVDCGSADGSLQQLQERDTQPDRVPFTLLQRPGVGRATALQAAIASAGDRDVVRLHADVVPDSPDWLRRLYAVIQARPDCGIVGGKIVMPSGRIQTCGRNLINGLGIVPEWSDLRWLEGDRDEPAGAREVDGVSGELCYYRAAMLAATGGLDPNYDPVFGDDDDLCLLARYHGWSVFVEPAVRAVHYAPRQSTTTTAPIPEPKGLLQRLLDDRQTLVRAHRDYFASKWGFDPEAPDLHEVRRRYGDTRICWRIGAALREDLPATPAVDVCLVTYNSMAVLPRALQHLAATRWPEVHVWITDNGSKDGTLEYLEQLRATFPFPLHVDRFPQNVGVAPALNTAFARGTAPIVARIDDDTLVSPDWLLGLVPRFHQRPYLGLIGPRVLHDNEGQALQCGPTRVWPRPFPGTGPEARDRVQVLCRTIAMRGCCNVYRRSVFARIGLLDVRFAPTQFDEWDHHIALAVAGYEALYDGHVTVRHLLTSGSSATPAAFMNARANMNKSNAKWGHRQWEALDRAIDLSIDGRFLPADGDTSALYRLLPPVPNGPPRAEPRDPVEVVRNTALARRRSLGRGLQGPLRDFWNQHLSLGADALHTDSDLLASITARLMDLLPQDPRALLLVANHRALEGMLTQAEKTARWALRLAPDDLEVQVAAQALLQPTTAALLPTTRPAAPVRVVLVPPLDPHDEAGHVAAELAHRALRECGVSCAIQNQLAPDVRGSEVAHFFGLGDAHTLLGRLQVARASQPQLRILLSTLHPDPGPTLWIRSLIAASEGSTPAQLRHLFTAAAKHELELLGQRERRLPPTADPLRRALERRCLHFVDRIVVHLPGELLHLQSLHSELPPASLLLEGAAPWPTAPNLDAAVPSGGILALGPCDATGNCVQLLLGLHDCGVPLTLCGSSLMPHSEWPIRNLAGSRVHWLPQQTGAALASTFAHSAVFVWLPSNAASFARPMQALAAGCELVLARGIGAEAIFGDRATYVDPCDLPQLRAEVLAAVARWQATPPSQRAPLPAEQSLLAYGQRLLGLYARAPALVPSLPPRTLCPV
jgi:GT2 family glycosyltransferase